MEPLLKLMDTGMYRLAPEEEELAARAAQKSELGYAPRHKVSGRTANLKSQGHSQSTERPALGHNSGGTVKP